MASNEALILQKYGDGQKEEGRASGEERPRGMNVFQKKDAQGEKPFAPGGGNGRKINGLIEEQMDAQPVLGDDLNGGKQEGDERGKGDIAEDFQIEAQRLINTIVGHTRGGDGGERQNQRGRGQEHDECEEKGDKKRLRPVPPESGSGFRPAGLRADYVIWLFGFHGIRLLSGRKISGFVWNYFITELRFCIDMKRMNALQVIARSAESLYTDSSDSGITEEATKA